MSRLVGAAAMAARRTAAFDALEAQLAEEGRLMDLALFRDARALLAHAELTRDETVRAARQLVAKRYGEMVRPALVTPAAPAHCPACHSGQHWGRTPDCCNCS